MLLIIALKWVVRFANETRRMEVGGIEIILAKAYDVVVLGKSRNKQTTIKLLDAGKVMGLEVNQEKTKYMFIPRNDSNDLSLQVDSYLFKKVSSIKYLGININNKNNVGTRINKKMSS